MSEAEFGRLPMLLTPGQARAVLGCTKATLRVLRGENTGLGVRLKGMRHWRYRKSAVKQLVSQ
jgi:hypothetical protein